MDFSHCTVTLEGDKDSETAGTAGLSYAVHGLPVSGVVESLRFVPYAAVTAHDTNYADISVELDGTEIASEQTTTGDTGNLTAGTDIELALTASGADLEVGAYSVFALKFTKAGTGVAVNGSVVARIRLDRVGS